MEEAELKTINEAVAAAIELHVNGKIRAVHLMLEKQNEKMDETTRQLTSHLEKEGAFQEEIRAHMEEVKPFLQGVAGLKILQKLAVWVGAVFVVWVAFRNSIKF